MCVCVVGDNPDMCDMLPHLRGQGIMDLEFEGDGEFRNNNNNKT